MQVTKSGASKEIKGIRRGERGYTLVEVMIGVAIMLLMFISFYAAMDTGTLTMRAARENFRATQIMEGRLEGLRLYTWSEVKNPNLFPTNFVEYYYPAGTNNGTGGITYTGMVTIAAAQLIPASSYATNMYQVTVQLNWTSGNSQRTRQMSTYFAKRGIENYVIKN